ncbi:MAG: Unknown protein [uncultured Sulfurovum sp.]|uniref:Uncharacterized protein n=1 Tax=uncultured Sulfurovum sp. TaxID=269237 RepID=A0A6S6TRV4_9BACT|nr:MAG: Unknown protein [uncultured Sulfurovum sp.]
MSRNKHKYIKLLLILILSVSIAHSFVLEENHQHVNCDHCVNESEQQHTPSVSKCTNINCELHNLYLASDTTALYLSEKVSTYISFSPNSYAYYHPNKLIKPPIA